MIIEVTQEDINKAGERSNTCPIAQAVKRMYGAHGFQIQVMQTRKQSVGYPARLNIWWAHSGEAFDRLGPVTLYRMGEDARRFMDSWDETHSVDRIAYTKPITIEAHQVPTYGEAA